MTGFSGAFNNSHLGTEGSVVPEDSVQRKVWETALRQGWQEGRQNADLTLEANQKTLTRDYRGMMLYSLLWRQGMITRPDVSDQMQTVTGDGKNWSLEIVFVALKIMRNSIFRNLTGVRL